MVRPPTPSLSCDLRSRHAHAPWQGTRAAYWFLQPVDPQALGLTDYLMIIKKPMDLGTIAKRLDSGHYASLNAVADDLAPLAPTARLHVTGSAYLESFAERRLRPPRRSCRSACATGGT